MSDEDLTIVATGTQFGKSQAGSLWLKRQIHMHTAKSDNFLIMAPSYKILRQSALPYFLQYMEGFGRYVGSDAEFKLKSGGTVFMRTGTDPDSIVGIPKTRAYWLDEAGKASLYFWENIQARAASVGAKGLLTTSPYSRNWLYKDYIKPHLRGDSNVNIIRAASWENPYHSLYDPVKREKIKATMDPRRFDMIFGGEWGQMVGLVYDCFDDTENQISPFDLPAGTKYYGGIDWGYNPDPFCLKIRAITPDGMHYGVSEFYKTGQTISDIIRLCKQKKAIYDVKNFFCDPSQPGYIEELNRNQIPCTPADNDILRGVSLHYEMIKTRRFKLFTGANPHSIDEYESYHYPDLDEVGPDQNEKVTKPVDQNNHAVDADRYISIMTYRGHLRLAPKVPGHTDKKQESFEQRIKRLTKIKSSGNTETW